MSGYFPQATYGTQRSGQQAAYSEPSRSYGNTQQAPQYSSQQVRYADPGYQQRQPQYQQSHLQPQAFQQRQLFPPSPPSTSSCPSSPEDTSCPEPSKKPYICVAYGCISAHARLADLQRHIERVHKVGETLHDCPVAGCNRVGKYGIGRVDKLRDHLREKHRFDIPKKGGRRDS